MGREVRRVPPNWQHPTMFNPYSHAIQLRSLYPAAHYERHLAEFRKDPEDWDNKEPDRANYEPFTAEEATWYQLWETVSEGTPVTPPFATPEELIEHLVAHGDDWDRDRANPGWDRTAAESMVREGFAFTMMVKDGKALNPADQEFWAD